MYCTSLIIVAIRIPNGKIKLINKNFEREFALTI